MTKDEMYETIERLIATGWEFKAHSYSPTTGWWILPTAGQGDVRGMRRGDPKPFHAGAIDTIQLYEL